MVFALLLLVQQSLFAQAVADREQQLVLDIQRSEFADGYETILAGERELVVVTQDSTIPITKGSAVILGEAGLGPFNKNGVADLATLLNQYGWVTMVMPAPSSAFFSPPNNEQGTQAEPEQTANDNAATTDEPIHPKVGQEVLTQESFDRQEQELVLQMQAIASKAQANPGFLLVIAEGTTAAWLNKIYAEEKLDIPDALIMVSPYWPQREFNQRIPDQLANTQMPVLDIYSQWDNEWSKRTVATRKVAAEKALKLHYRQRELIGQMIDKQQYHLLSKEIYGWLTQMGW